MTDARRDDSRSSGVRVERKLTAILYADVYGYSRLMGGDEEATLATLTAHRKVIGGSRSRIPGECRQFWPSASKIEFNL